MSVMVMKKELMERIGKYLSLTNSEERAEKITLRWHELNVRNYVKRYEKHGETFQGLEFDKLELDRVAIPSAVQVYQDLRGLYYNCSDFADEIDQEAFEKIYERIQRVEASPEYKITKQYADKIAY